MISADANVLPGAINGIVTGEGTTNYVQLKPISRSILSNIQGLEKIPWGIQGQEKIRCPPTPKDRLKSNEFLNLVK